MRIVALEEHYTVPGIVAGIDTAAIARAAFPPIRRSPGRRQ